jgi:hypothetical protein
MTPATVAVVPGTPTIITSVVATVVTALVVVLSSRS